jgi:predicted enzyme related to lactoylglutathione lyase
MADSITATPARNRHGGFIWYELITADADAAAAFYAEVIGWTASDAGVPGIDYRLFSANGTDVAGHMNIPAEGAEMGMRPGWYGFVGVDDVDAAVAAIEGEGGTVLMPAMDIEGVGRMALVTDPQHVPFYVMRGASEEASSSFARQDGHCVWNELSPADQQGALAFYTGQFGWEPGDAMPMGEVGDYVFLNHGGEMIGAVSPTQGDGPLPMWRFYFQVRDIDAAAAKVAAAGGTVRHGPHPIPGGAYIIVATDPHGAVFGAVGPRKA